MRGTGRLLRAGVEKVWGPGRHMAGNNTFSYFLDPHGNTDRVHDRARGARRGHLAPAPVRLLRPRGHRPVGHREPDERVRRQAVVQRPRPRRVRRPAGLMPHEARHLPATTRGRTGRRRRRRRPRAPLPARRSTVRDADRRAGCDARSALGDDAPRRQPADPAGRRPAAARRWQPPTCATSSPSRSTSRACGAASTAPAASPEAWYDAPTFYFTNPHALIGPDDDVAVPRRVRGCATSSSRSPSSSAARARR